jgi:hypothetical protein
MTIAARVIRVKAFSGADLVTIEAAINAWFAGAGEKTFLSAVFQASAMAGDPYTCLVFYSE